MSTVDVERLRGIKSFPELVDFLRDDLDWPLDAEGIEDLTFEYEPDELGIDPETAVKITEIKQLRPLSPNQPWGIFYVEFEPKRLPVVVLRRVLQKLVIKKRQFAQTPHRQAWDLHDLLFISSCGETNERSLTFAHFSEDEESKLPTLRVVGWDAQDTPLHIDRCIAELGCLKYDEQLQADQWRERWSKAFTLEHREVIKTSKALAQKLATLARRIRNRVNSVLAVESEKGPMRQLHKAFQETLIHDLSTDDFADMYAQTITYGLFSTKKSRPANLVAENLVDMIPRTNPFLRELLSTFLTVGGRKAKIDFDELGVDDVVQTLRNTDMDAVLRDFGDSKPEEDPVIHFYEDFLREYDAEKKVKRGVFYTPKPVVSYIVRSVHELLQTEFGLEDGLASTATWGEMLKKHPGLKLPPLTDLHGEERTISPNEPFVQILDPATGTATFLVEVIDIMHKTMYAKWEKEGHLPLELDTLWNDYVPQHLLPRLHAFELMMAPYAIAHMKIGLKLAETGYRFCSEERARIYLTNALEPWVKQLPLIGFDALAHEAAAVNEIKRHRRFTVVIGNPPYSGESMNKGEWIRNLIDDYMYVAGEHLNEKGKKNWLQDDYVKFLRASQWLIQQSDIGVVGLITNHSYLDNPTFRGMRASLIDTFGGLRFLDLHGNSKKKEQCPDGSKDENVFDILVGVAVGLFVRNSCKDLHCVEHSEMWGLRPAKYRRLLDSVLSSTTWKKLSPALPFFVFVPQDVGVREEYEHTWKITEAFPHWGAGIITSRDHFIIDFDDQPIRERLEVFRNVNITEDRVREELQISDNSMWSIADARRQFRAKPINNDLFVPCLYRPFDTRRIYFETNVVFNMRIQVMRHMVAGRNLGFNIGRAGQVIDQGEWNIIFCTPSIAEFNLFRRGGNSLIPLYIYPDTDDEQASLGSEAERRPNLSHSFLKDLASGLGLPLVGLNSLPRGLTPEDIFHYAYAVFHSPGYRSRYAEFLKIDFPRLPLTGNLELFRALARLGGELTAMHLLESPKLKKPITEFIGNNHQVSKVGWTPDHGGTVWLDGKGAKGNYQPGTGGFRPVPEEVWNFHIGGYQVCEKWLKDRGPKKGNPGRKLTAEDMAHYQKIVVALNETIKLMTQIDETIEARSGWPIK